MKAPEGAANAVRCRLENVNLLPVDRKKSVSPPLAWWRWAVRLHDRINDCWIGDVIGVASLFVGLFAFLTMTGVW